MSEPVDLKEEMEKKKKKKRKRIWFRSVAAWLFRFINWPLLKWPQHQQWRCFPSYPYIHEEWIPCVMKCSSACKSKERNLHFQSFVRGDRVRCSWWQLLDCVWSQIRRTSECLLPFQHEPRSQRFDLVRKSNWRSGKERYSCSELHRIRSRCIGKQQIDRLNKRRRWWEGKEVRTWELKWNKWRRPPLDSRLQRPLVWSLAIWPQAFSSNSGRSEEGRTSVEVATLVSGENAEILKGVLLLTLVANGFNRNLGEQPSSHCLVEVRELF